MGSARRLSPADGPAGHNGGARRSHLSDDHYPGGIVRRTRPARELPVRATGSDLSRARARRASGNPQRAAIRKNTEAATFKQLLTLLSASRRPGFRAWRRLRRGEFAAQAPAPAAGVRASAPGCMCRRTPERAPVVWPSKSSTVSTSVSRLVESGWRRCVLMSCRVQGSPSGIALTNAATRLPQPENGRRSRIHRRKYSPLALPAPPAPAASARSLRPSE